MNPLTPIENGLEWVLNRLHENAGLSYGWSIVVLVLIVRAALLPLVIKQYRSMRQMQLVAPQVKEIQQKYKGDKRKQQEELMRFYQENQINPFSSCLPMLPQLPVFFALYFVLRDFAEGGNDGTDLGFMGLIPDISANVSDLPLWSKVVIALIYGGSQLLSSELSFEPHTPEMQRRILRLLPIAIVIGAFVYPFPAGLAIYWLTSNMWTAGQQLVIRHKIGLHIAAQPEDAGKTRSSRTPPKEKAMPAKGATANGASEETTESGEGGAEAAEAPPVSIEKTAKSGGGSRKPTSGSGTGGGNRRRTPRQGGGNRPSGQRRAPKKRR